MLAPGTAAQAMVIWVPPETHVSVIEVGAGSAVQSMVADAAVLL